MLLLAETITPRLRYITAFIGKEILGEEIRLTEDAIAFANASEPCIDYTGKRLRENAFHITPHGLLAEKGIKLQAISCFKVNGQTAFFKTDGDFPFDVFSAAFYLLSRYEEYLPHQKDMYGRFAHEQSLAFREGFLSLPLINIWLSAFGERLQQFFGDLKLRSKATIFLPTYDIDIAWSYKSRGLARTAGSMLRSILKGDMQAVRERREVLRNIKPDPFHAYQWMDALHDQYKLRPYFFLLAKRRGQYDKNISPQQKPLQTLLRSHVGRYPVGIHPSWRSGDETSLVKEEIATLVTATGTPVIASRQHYIRFNLPGTFRTLIAAGIQFEFSMGYGSINGFRSSVCSPHFWYDLEKEIQTGLTLFPFCFMEANSFYEQKYTAAQAFAEMKYYYEEVNKVQGTFIMIWHNSFLGTDPLYAGWREQYQRFINDVCG